MEPLDLNVYGSQSSSEVSHDDIPTCPVGREHQVEIPDLATEDERRDLINSSLHGYSYPIAVGLALPIMWASPKVVHQKKLQKSEIMETAEIMASSEDKQNPLPYSPIAVWSNHESELFVLGLYIFGKHPNQLSRFLGNKTVGDVLSYYYGKFYNSDAYKKWLVCRKTKSNRCIIGERIFHGWRQSELMSRLRSMIPKEAHDSLLEVFKMFSDSQTSLEEFVLALKSTAGTEAFVEVVGIGKGHDLTGFATRQSKQNNPDLASANKDFSSLASEDIIKLIPTSDSRRSKTKSDDVFWEAVWPRLLLNGWHSEQPKDVRASKNYIVFLVPGVEVFCRTELTKGVDYFDNISDVLKRVTADPVLLELEAGGDEKGSSSDVMLNEDSPLDEYQEKFTIVDTTLVEGDEPFSITARRSLPGDAVVHFGLKHHRTSSKASVSASAAEMIQTKTMVKNAVAEVYSNKEAKSGKGRKDKVVSADSKKKEKADFDMGSISESISHGGMKADEAPSFSNNNSPNVAASEEAEVKLASPKSGPENPRRHGTRNRAPTVKSLEAIAFGLLGSRKRKIA